MTKTSFPTNSQSPHHLVTEKSLETRGQESDKDPVEKNPKPALVIEAAGGSVDFAAGKEKEFAVPASIMNELEVFTHDQAFIETNLLEHRAFGNLQ